MSTIALMVLLLLVPTLLAGLLWLRSTGTRAKRGESLHIGRELADEATTAVLDVVDMVVIPPEVPASERDRAERSQARPSRARWRAAGKPDL